MAFTSPELVRTHLDTARLGQIMLVDLPVVLNGSDPAQLPHAGLIEGSVVVKCHDHELKISNMERRVDQHGDAINGLDRRVVALELGGEDTDVLRDG